MNITSDKTTEVHHHTRVVDLEGAPVMEVPGGHWSHKGKSLEPRRASANWGHGTIPTSVTVYGLLLKKDGTVGASTFDLMYSLTDEFHWPSRAVAPQWLKDIFLEGR